MGGFIGSEYLREIHKAHLQTLNWQSKARINKMIWSENALVIRNTYIA